MKVMITSKPDVVGSLPDHLEPARVTQVLGPRRRRAAGPRQQ